MFWLINNDTTFFLFLFQYFFKSFFTLGCSTGKKIWVVVALLDNRKVFSQPPRH